MKQLMQGVLIVVTLVISACSSTGNQPSYQTMHEIQPVEKKPLTTDRALLISLLNRPLTADMQMMLAFAASLNPEQENPIAPVMIVGEVPNQANNIRYQTPLWKQVYQDRHAIPLKGPK